MGVFVRNMTERSAPGPLGHCSRVHLWGTRGFAAGDGQKRKEGHAWRLLTHPEPRGVRAQGSGVGPPGPTPAFSRLPLQIDEF